MEIFFICIKHLLYTYQPQPWSVLNKWLLNLGSEWFVRCSVRCCGLWTPHIQGMWVIEVGAWHRTQTELLIEGPKREVSKGLCQIIENWTVDTHKCPSERKRLCEIRTRVICGEGNGPMRREVQKVYRGVVYIACIFCVNVICTAQRTSHMTAWPAAPVPLVEALPYPGAKSPSQGRSLQSLR